MSHEPDPKYAHPSTLDPVIAKPQHSPETQARLDALYAKADSAAVDRNDQEKGEFQGPWRRGHYAELWAMEAETPIRPDPADMMYVPPSPSQQTPRADGSGGPEPQVARRLPVTILPPAEMADDGTVINMNNEEIQEAERLSAAWLKGEELQNAAEYVNEVRMAWLLKLALRQLALNNGPPIVAGGVVMDRRTGECCRPRGEFSAVKDSGVRQDFDTGSRRDTREGKGRYDLLPPYALHRLARHFENGARKYDPRNWEKGQPLSRYLDSAIRHAFEFLQGQRDEDHAIAAVWNLLCLVETEHRIAKGMLPAILNDLPPETI